MPRFQSLQKPLGCRVLVCSAYNLYIRFADADAELRARVKHNKRVENLVTDGPLSLSGSPGGQNNGSISMEIHFQSNITMERCNDTINSGSRHGHLVSGSEGLFKPTRGTLQYVVQRYTVVARLGGRRLT